MENKLEELEKRLLQKAGLPNDATQIVGRTFKIVCKNFKHDIGHDLIVYGKVEAIEISTFPKITIFVSSPRFWGEKIYDIEYEISDVRILKGRYVVCIPGYQDVGRHEVSFNLL